MTGVREGRKVWTFLRIQFCLLQLWHYELVAQPLLDLVFFISKLDIYLFPTLRGQLHELSSDTEAGFPEQGRRGVADN